MATTIPPATSLVLSEVAGRRGQIDPQILPLVDELLVSQRRPHARFAEEYEIPTSLRAAQLMTFAATRGELTWLHILASAVSDFMGAAQDAGHDEAASARAELVRLAAVAVAAIEAIDRAATVRKATTI